MRSSLTMMLPWTSVMRVEDAEFGCVRPAAAVDAGARVLGHFVAQVRPAAQGRRQHRHRCPGPRPRTARPGTFRARRAGRSTPNRFACPRPIRPPTPYAGTAPKALNARTALHESSQQTSHPPFAVGTSSPTTFSLETMELVSTAVSDAFDPHCAVRRRIAPV